MIYFYKTRKTVDKFFDFKIDNQNNSRNISTYVA